MKSEIKKNLLRNLSNLPGWRTNRKIVVFESDDWGSIRMPSNAAFKELEQAGVNLIGRDALRYNINDSIETADDLANLFEVLASFSDKSGNNAVFTPVCIVANPDYDKIKLSGFKEYHYETFTETLKRYPGCENTYNLYIEGIRNKLFVPQSHGREHLNITAWLDALQKEDPHTILAFKEKMLGFVPNQKEFPGIDFNAAFLPSLPTELECHKQVLKEGLFIFEKLFGYRAVYFVPPNGPFNNSLNTTLAENGIRFRSSAKIQHEPLGYGKSRRSIHWLGQKDKNGITYITRNCFFEPSHPGKDWLNSCLYDLDIAFRWNKPAIISSHRVNYTGALNTSNRDQGLKKLTYLLQAILKKWPDVEFMTTAQLGNLITINNAFD